MITLKNVCKSFGEQEVLKDFSLEIADGERVALTGRSGAGKTTVLNIIMGLVNPESGEVKIPKGLKIGAVFQEDRLIEPLSAEANCLVAMKSKNAEEVKNLLSKLGLDGEIIKKRVGLLSGGERRRVVLARAFLCDAQLLILDEPFKGIDKNTLPLCIAQTDEAAKGKTLILVTHSEDEAKSLGCRTVKI